MKFTVDRSRWRCGSDEPEAHGRGANWLLNVEGFQCCLGFVCEQSGISKEILTLHSEPSSFLEPLLGQIDFLFKKKKILYRTVCLEQEAMRINDGIVGYEGLSREDRETALINLFAEFGHELEFVGKYTDEAN